tara:strand:- start:79 stop:261 length:183 start_codon:yes stop_codon:yes gene_type:complete
LLITALKYQVDREKPQPHVPSAAIAEKRRTLNASLSISMKVFGIATIVDGQDQQTTRERI